MHTHTHSPLIPAQILNLVLPGMALNPNASEKPGIMPRIRHFSKEEEDDLASWRYKDLPEGKSEKGLRSAHSMTSILKRKEKSRFNL